MEYLQLIQKRYSTRAYKPDPVEEEKLLRILEAARIAPTAANRQPFRLIVLPTEGNEKRLAQVYSREWICQAPLIICACGLKDEAWIRKDGRSYLDVDVAIIMDHLILAAANEGLGTCWIAAFDRKEACDLFKLPEEVEPIILTPLGYPLDELKPKQRKPLKRLVYYNYWGGSKKT
jgi:nitroreductase